MTGALRLVLASSLALAHAGGSARRGTAHTHCKVQFGTFFRKDANANSRASDYLTIWLGTKSKANGYGFNPYWHGRMLDRVRTQNATAVYYSYVVAMLARYAKGIKDCDVGSPNLCVYGADFVREHESLILHTYESYANQTAAVLGRHAQVVWLMEPDWHQYSAPTQHGGGLSHSTMVRLFVSMVARIKRHLPHSLISLDVSPWISDVGQWMSPFLAHGSVDYVHTSGGRTTANSARIRAQEQGNFLTWAELHRLSGRGIIADTGYGVGGKSTTEQQPEHETAWLDPQHLRARIADGVIAVTFANPSSGWSERVNSLRYSGGGRTGGGSSSSSGVGVGGSGSGMQLPLARHCFGVHARHGRANATSTTRGTARKARKRVVPSSSSTRRDS